MGLSNRYGLQLVPCQSALRNFKLTHYLPAQVFEVHCIMK